MRLEFLPSLVPAPPADHADEKKNGEHAPQGLRFEHAAQPLAPLAAWDGRDLFSCAGRGPKHRHALLQLGFHMKATPVTDHGPLFRREPNELDASTQARLMTYHCISAQRRVQ